MKKELEKLKVGKLVKITWEDAVEYFRPSEHIYNKLDINYDVGWVISQDKKAVTLVRSSGKDGFIHKSSIMIIPKVVIKKVRIL